MHENLSATDTQLQKIRKSSARLLALFGVEGMWALNGENGPIPATQLTLAIRRTAMAANIGEGTLPMMIITKPKDSTTILADTVINYRVLDPVHDPTRGSQIVMSEDNDNGLHATISTFPHIAEATDLSTTQADDILKDLLRQHQDIFGLLYTQ